LKSALPVKKSARSAERLVARPLSEGVHAWRRTRWWRRPTAVGREAGQSSAPIRPAAARSTRTPSVTLTLPLASTSQTAVAHRRQPGRGAERRTPSVSADAPLPSASPQTLRGARGRRTDGAPITTTAASAAR
jgi:hypothetical protein